ncbi:unnamed protein product [Ambrosiozyma monospora]|uniref:Unnamed protein product n=1 Tax=Ambrosiozyma monospora TaxID=43982 RepID=A0ACB5SUZ6_AMBMO|nr:unnamed protein product [Ambrosiozyma monospora]
MRKVYPSPAHQEIQRGQKQDLFTLISTIHPTIQRSHVNWNPTILNIHWNHNYTTSFSLNLYHRHPIDFQIPNHTRPVMSKHDTDFSKYCIKQHNSNTYDPNYMYLPQISANTADNFAGIAPHELHIPFVNGLYETMNSRGQKWIEFVLVDTTSDEVAASARFLIKKTNSPNCSNVVVSWVNTNKKYQKQGLMGFLLAQCIQKFEDPDGFTFDGELSDDVGAAEFVKSELKTSDNFWTLYSAVKDYYARFGFSSFKGGLKIITSPPIPIPTSTSTSTSHPVPTKQNIPI